MKTTLHFIVCLLLFSSLATAQPGSLDMSFGPGGIAITNIGGSAQDTPNDLAIQPDGKLLVAGFSTTAGATDIALVRYLPDGTLDASFGTGGIVKTDLGGTADQASAVLVLPDGKIVVAGTIGQGNLYDLFVARFLADGNLDTSFGTGGKAVADLGSSFDYANAAALQPDGKIVVAGFKAVGFGLDFGMARFQADGTLDAGFGTGGVVTTHIFEENQVTAVDIQPDGKIVVAGFASIAAKGDYAVARYLPDGSLDPDFGDSGFVTTDLEGNNNSDVGTCLALQPDGKLVVAGYANYVNLSFAAEIGLVRYNADGSLDEVFGNAGISVQNVGVSTFVEDMALNADGKIYLVGQSHTNNTNKRWLVVRCLPNGELDPSFGTDGAVYTDMVGSTSEHFTAALVQPDQKIVAAGRMGATPNLDFGVARYLPGLSATATLVQGVTCFGGADGSIEIAALGGAEPYAYSLNGVDFQASPVFAGLPAGSYTITVLDASGSTTTVAVEVTEPNAGPDIFLDLVENDLTITVAGDPVGYLFSIDGGLTFQASPVFTDLANGVYEIVVQDAAGCTASATVVVNFTSTGEPLPGFHLGLSPNPSDGLLRLSLTTPGSQLLEVWANDLSGRVVWQKKVRVSDNLIETIDLRAVPPGSYQVAVGSGKSIWAKKWVVIQ